MLKNILKSSVVALAAAVAVAGATSAAFTAQATINSNTFSTGTAQLSLWDGTDWVQSMTGVSFIDIYPGWSNWQPIALKNTGTVDLVVGLDTTETFASTLDNEIMVYVYLWDDAGDDLVFVPGEEDVLVAGPVALSALEGTIPAQQIDAGTTVKAVIMYELPSTSTAQGLSTVYNYVFNGTTDGVL